MIKVPKKVFDLVLVFRIALALAAILGVLSGCTNDLNWVQGTTPLVQQAISENTLITSPEEIAQVATTTISKDLTLIDYRNQGICGSEGCLYSIYLQGKEIWSKYLPPALPPKMKLFAISDQTNHDYPCLDLKQYNHKKLLALSYCFDGQTYTLQNSEEIKTDL